MATDGSRADVAMYAPRMASHELTREGYERLRAELHELSTEKRVEISLWIERAREHGDIKENADYDAAKNTQGLNEARIRQLEQMLKHAIVVDGTGAGDAVTPGVIVELDIDGDVETYFFGSIEERQTGHDILTPSSPMGSVLVGAKVGEVRQFQTPRGSTIAVTVRSVAPFTR
jgi:transcription elongation factor GreA